MAQLKVERLTEVLVYHCDGLDCEELCDQWSSPTSSECSWKFINDDASHSSDLNKRRYFCSWTCLAEWAAGKACETGEVTCAA